MPPPPLHPDFSQPFRFCGCKESVLAAALTARWPDGNIPWTIVDELPRIAFDDLKAAMTRALSRWAAVCGINPTYTDTARNARLLVGSRAIDGAGRVLAECELPMGQSQCRLWFDVGEDWALELTPAGRRIVLELVGWHEAGHGLGLGHAPEGSLNVMAPTYNPKQLTPGSWDIAQLQVRYGKPRGLPTPVPQPTPTPVPSGGSLVGNILKTLLMNALKSWLENLLKSGQLEKFLQDFLTNLMNNKPQTVEALMAEATDAAVKNGVPLA